MPVTAAEAVAVISRPPATASAPIRYLRFRMLLPLVLIRDFLTSLKHTNRPSDSLRFLRGLLEALGEAVHSPLARRLRRSAVVGPLVARPGDPLGAQGG